MSQPETDDIENRADMNTGQNWSQMDLLDLANCIRLNEPVEEIASFMCRSRREIRDSEKEPARAFNELSISRRSDSNAA